MKPVVYTTQREGPFDRAFEYRNPKRFQQPLGRPADVIVVGNWPRIVAAYEAQGARVFVLPKGATARLPVDVPAPPAGLLVDPAQIGSMRKADLIEALKARGMDAAGTVAVLRERLQEAVA